MYPTWPLEKLCAMLEQRVWDLYRSFIRARWGLPLTKSPRPYSLDYNRSGGRKQSTPSTSRTPVTKHGEQSTNILAGLDAPPACAPANSITSQLMKNRAHKTSDCEPTRLVYKQLSNLWKIPTPELHIISEPFRPEECAAALRRLKPGTSPGLDPSSRSLYSTPGRLSNLVLRLPQFLHAPTQNSKDLEKSTSSWNPYVREAYGGP